MTTEKALGIVERFISNRGIIDDDIKQELYATALSYKDASITTVHRHLNNVFIEMTSIDDNIVPLQGTYELDVDAFSIREALDYVLNTRLTDVQCQVIKGHFYERKTLIEIEHDLGIEDRGGMKALQIELQALRKLRYPGSMLYKAYLGK